LGKGLKGLGIRHRLDRGGTKGPVTLAAGVEQGLTTSKLIQGAGETISIRRGDRDVEKLDGMAALLEPGQSPAAGGATRIAPDF